MKNGKLIQFDRSMLLLKRADALVLDTDLFLSDTDNGVRCLLDALPHAQPPQILKILPLLGYAGKDSVLWPLYRLVIEPLQDEQIRLSAAVQLGMAASLSEDASTINGQLIEKLYHRDPSVRSCCALALGWEGNGQAVNALFLHLSDPDRDVQSAVISALSAVGGLGIFNQLRDLLKFGMVEEKRSILLNIWRFYKKIQAVEDVYVDSSTIIEPELRADLLSGMGMIPLSEKILGVYGRLLSEDDFQTRFQVMTNLTAYTPGDYFLLRDNLVELVNSDDDRIRQLAIRLLSKR